MRPSSPANAARPPTLPRQQSFHVALEKIREDSLYTHFEEVCDSPLSYVNPATSYEPGTLLVEEQDPLDVPREGRKFLEIPTSPRDRHRPWWKRIAGKRGRIAQPPPPPKWLERKSSDKDVEMAVGRKFICSTAFERRVLMGSWVAMLVLLSLAIWFISRETR